MNHETRLHFLEHAAMGYGPDRDVTITVPREGGCPETSLSPVSQPPHCDIEQGYHSIYFICDGPNQDDFYALTALWLPERGDWVCVEHHSTHEGYRGADESISGPYTLGAAFMDLVRQIFPSGRPPTDRPA